MTSEKLSSWRISLIRKKGDYVGTVQAPTAEAAIKQAIEEFQITLPHEQRRLVAQRDS